jgi:hypothetical protein
MNYESLKALDYRIGIISDLKVSLNETDNKEISRRYYTEVAYFVNTIYQNDELSFLFNELLNYSSRLTLNEEYSKAILNIRQSIKSIANQLLTHEKFTEFETIEKNGGWKNPFDSSAICIEVRPLLEGLRDLDNNKLCMRYVDIFTLLNSSDGLNGILNHFLRTSNLHIQGIKNELNSFNDNLLILHFHSKFQHDFLGVNSAFAIKNIYDAIHPVITTTDSNKQIINGWINSGENTIERDNLLSHCKRIKEYFHQKLTTKFSIDFAINKFKHYMEIFQIDYVSGNSETYFQREFELFMFNNGYYALSQGQVGNGRYDDIILDDNNAFLFEHKQIGFGNKSDSKLDCLNKFKSGKIQTEIYHQRLKLHPRLSNDVFIVIFSKHYIRLKNGTTNFKKEGINFNFKLICLDKKAPSKIKKVNEVDIAELFD